MRRRSYFFFKLLLLLSVLPSFLSLTHNSSTKNKNKHLPSSISDHNSLDDIIKLKNNTSHGFYNQKLTESKNIIEKSNILQHNQNNFSRYPRNITDTYKGRWSYVYRNETSSLWEFEKEEGLLLIQAHNNPSPVPAIDFVLGELFLRDGIYSTDFSYKYSLQGLYFWGTGEMLLFANPAGEPIIQDFSMKLPQNATFSDALQASDMLLSSIDVKNATKSCFLQLVLKAKPMLIEQISFLEQESKKEALHRDRDSPLISLSTLLYSSNCDVILSANITSVIVDEYYAKAINYVVMVAFISFIQILLIIRQMEFTNTQASASKVSLLTIGMQAILDSYICLIHLTTGLVVESVFNAFATASFFKFITFAVFEMRYLLIIWKSRRPQAFSEGLAAMRREFSMLYARFYVSVMIGLVLLYYLSGIFFIFVFIIYSFWIPQIVCNIQHDTKGALGYKYIIGISITRLCIPLYFYLCPENFVRFEPSPITGLCLTIYLFVQVIILLAQDRFGPRFFIPKRLLPLKYDYYRMPDPQQLEADERECVICMNRVEILGSGEHMITPCNHLFHSYCLNQWMTFKLECPTCRRTLPAQ